jgi:hypothetical protein
MKAINYYLVIEKIKEEPKNVGGFIITDKQSNDIRYLKAKVISTGDLVKGISDGDIIHYWTHKLFWTLIRLSKQTPNLHIPFEPIIYNDSHD